MAVAGTVAIATAIVSPVGYFLTALRYELHEAQGTADRGADSVSEFAVAHPDTWHFEEPWLVHILARISARNDPTHRRIIVPDGHVLATAGPVVDGPLIQRHAVVTDGEKEVAYVEVTASLRPALLGTAVVGLFGIALGTAVFVALRAVPMRALERALRSLDQVLKSLRESQAALAEEVTAKVAALSQAEQMAQAMRHLALHDPLTGLPNRVLFQDRLEHGLHSCQRTGAPLAVVVLDLDRFKEVNDTLGHQAGDRLLQELAGRVQAAVRRSDTVARLGGDEFALLLRIARLEDARTVAETVCRAIAPPVVLDGRPITLGASCGVALYPQHGADPQVLLQRADVAMYQAKSARGGVAVYDSAHDPNSPARLQRLTDLRLALEREEFFLCYQPKVALASAEVLGVEALIRWGGRPGGPVPPEEFIPLAEETRLINPISLWVLKRALEEVVWWQARGIELSVAVNLSPTNLEDPELPAKVERLLAQTGVAPQRLILEITEGAMMTDPGRALEALTHLHQAGVKLSVDDFGTGYSSLAYLQRLPASEIKIDRTFVAAMVHDRGNALIVRSTIDLAHGLGLSVVAEGIEDAETWETLHALGCDAGQGYYIARPTPGRELLEWLKSPPLPLARTA